MAEYIPELDTLEDVSCADREQFLHDLIEWIYEYFIPWIKKLQAISNNEVNLKASLSRVMDIVEGDNIKEAGLQQIKDELTEEFMAKLAEVPECIPFPEVPEPEVP